MENKKFAYEAFKKETEDRLKKGVSKLDIYSGETDPHSVEADPRLEDLPKKTKRIQTFTLRIVSEAVCTFAAGLNPLGEVGGFIGLIARLDRFFSLFQL